ncbi:hypothetical protein HH214_14495 [Mucilaginibacter robiniae]|uniref:Uncharacterized protein n=1 Tax=Mucilaginibacter robiniae TaxID=2728022 RepID=A0A7L5E0U5_9SPHI|nr:hypothetical protein [Mucilaginibacter robiniae]QJD96992.1 hypothetical protein HH214_14495 [Mucilaginibacter robiniae]
MSAASFAFTRGTLGLTGTGALPKVTLKASQTSFTYTPASGLPSTTTNTVLANVVTAAITDVSGSDKVTGLLSSILSASHPIVPTTSEQSIFDGLASVSLNLFGTDRPVTVQYSISTVGISQLLKAAGTYTLPLVYTSYGALGGVNSTANVSLTIQVSAFTIINGLADVPRLKFTQAADYINGPQSVPVQHSFNVTSTIPYTVKLKTGYSTFADQNGINQPGMLVSHIKTQAGSSGGHVTAISALATTDNIVLTGNSALQITESTMYSMSAQYTSAYLNAGTYNTPVVFTMSNSVGQTQSINTNLYIDVSPIAQLGINGPVDLSFLTADDYRNGIHTDLTNHLHVDKNSPYDIYVKAGGAYLQGNGTNISLSNLISIQPIVNSSAIPGAPHTIKLSTAYQAIITGGGPDINKNIGVRYAISAADAQKLLNKPAGTYSATIIYSFTAQ